MNQAADNTQHSWSGCTVVMEILQQWGPNTAKLNKLIKLFLKNQLYYYKKLHAAAAAKLLQLCLTLCDPIDGSPPGSATPGILQARTLEWVAISFSNAWKWKVKVKSLSRDRKSVV